MALSIRPDDVGADGVWRGSFRNAPFYQSEINFSGTTGSWIPIYNTDTGVLSRGYVLLADRATDALFVAPDFA